MFKKLRRFFRHRLSIHKPLKTSASSTLGTATSTPEPEPEHVYRAYAQARWPRPSSENNGVVLVSMINVGVTIHAQAIVTNFLARYYGCRLVCSSFIGYRNKQLDEIYESFHAPVQLGFHLSNKFKENASFDAQSVFSKLKSRKDVLAISREGIALGDLIYDTYLRLNYRGTVDLFDLRLRDMIERTFIMFDICSNFLIENQVKAFVTSSHGLFIYDGVLERLCQWNGLPCFDIPWPDPFIIRLNDCDFLDGPSESYANWPGRWRSRSAGNVAASLSPGLREKGIRLAKEMLEERLSGKPDYLVIPSGNGSVYGVSSEMPLLENSGKPRILLMLHDFCDGAHVFPLTCFDDFYDWASYTLDKASKTPFDWYVKTHPLRGNESQDSKEIDRISTDIVAEFQRRFPNIRFLSPDCNNKQLIQEGISAMFTLHGTAAFEFAYFGIPVVVAGPCPQQHFSFNICPRTLAEYDHYIANADQLKVNIDTNELFLAYHITDWRFQRSLISDEVNLTPANVMKEFQGREYFRLWGSLNYLSQVAMHQDPEHDRMVLQVTTEYMNIYKDQIDANRAFVLDLRSRLQGKY